MQGKSDPCLKQLEVQSVQSPKTYQRVIEITELEGTLNGDLSPSHLQ